MRDGTEKERSAIFAVLAAAAREAEELLAEADASDDMCPEARQEADRRLRLFMRKAGRTI